MQTKPYYCPGNSGAVMPNSHLKTAGNWLKAAHCLCGNGRLPSRRQAALGVGAVFASEDIYPPARRDLAAMPRAGQDGNGMQGRWPLPAGGP